MYNISKYHGCGNNFVIMQEAELAEQLGVPCGEESAGAYAKFAARVCDESVGVGADGFIIVRTEPVLEMHRCAATASAVSPITAGITRSARAMHIR